MAARVEGVGDSTVAHYLSRIDAWKARQQVQREECGEQTKGRVKRIEEGECDLCGHLPASSPAYIEAAPLYTATSSQYPAAGILELITSKFAAYHTPSSGLLGPIEVVAHGVLVTVRGRDESCRR